MTLAKQLENYISDANTTKRVPQEEATRLGRIFPISREIYTHTSPQDQYKFLGELALQIEEMFSEIFLHHRIGWFTGYKVEQIQDDLSYRFKITTTGVQMGEKEWYG